MYFYLYNTHVRIRLPLRSLANAAILPFGRRLAKNIYGMLREQVPGICVTRGKRKRRRLGLHTRLKNKIMKVTRRKANFFSPYGRLGYGLIHPSVLPAIIFINKTASLATTGLEWTWHGVAVPGVCIRWFTKAQTHSSNSPSVNLEQETPGDLIALLCFRIFYRRFPISLYIISRFHYFQDYLQGCLVQIEEMVSSQAKGSSGHASASNGNSIGGGPPQRPVGDQNTGQEKILEHGKAGTPTDVRDVHF